MLVCLVLKGRDRPRFFTSGAGLAARRAQEAEWVVVKDCERNRSALKCRCIFFEVEIVLLETLQFVFGFFLDGRVQH